MIPIWVDFSLSHNNSITNETKLIMAARTLILLTAVKNSSHVNRLLGLGIEKDISFCLEMDKYPVLPRLSNGALILE